MSGDRESLYSRVLAQLEALAAAVEAECRSCSTMEAVEELIGASAAGGSACVPCLEHHVREALRLGVAPDDIRRAVAAGVALARSAGAEAPVRQELHS